MTDNLIDRAKAALEGVTPGEWGVDWYICRADPVDVKYEKTRRLKRGETRKKISVGDELWRKPRNIGPICPDHDHWAGWHLACSEEDARFIAAARQLVPDLIAAIEARDARVDGMKRALDIVAAHGWAQQVYEELFDAIEAEERASGECE